MINTTKNSTLLEEIRSIHTKSELCGRQENSILNISEDLILYVLSLLRDETPVLPNTSIFEWDKLLLALRPHLALPLLYWKIGQISSDLHPPEEIINRMRQSFMWSRSRYFQMEIQLHTIIDAFNKEGINVLVLKGPGLARTIYPDTATRPSSDIDLLVCPDQMIAARNILLKLGYNCPEKRFEAFRDFHCDEEFTHKDGQKNNYGVEVHWALNMFSDSKWKVDINEIVSRAVKVETPGLCFKILHPVDNLMHVSLHMLIRHPHDIRLIWIYDCALLAHQLTLTNNWEMLIEKSNGREVHIVLIKALEMARLWYDTKVPSGFNGFSIRTGFRGPGNTAFPDPNRWLNKQIFKFPIKLIFSNELSLYKKIHHLFQIIFPHPDVVRMKYPPSHSWLLPLSYLQRWWKWIKKLILN